MSMPRHFLSGGRAVAHDPENVLSELIVGGQRYGHSLQLHRTLLSSQELYELEPDVCCSPHRFTHVQVLKSEQGIDYALLMPLTDSGRMIGGLLGLGRHPR